MASQGYMKRFHAHQVLGNFSVDEDGLYRDDRRMRRTFVEPDDEVRNMSLLEGIDDYDYDGGQAGVVSGQGEQPSSMTSLLEWMRDHRGELVGHDILKISETRKLDIDFAGKRGVFCRLLRAIESIDRMEVLVTLCNGTYYIESLRDAEKTTASKETDYSLKNFKRHVTLVNGVHPDIVTNTDDNSFYCAVLKTGCGDHRILLSSEVQAERDDSNKSPPENYVDIKMRHCLNSDQAKSNFGRYTSLKWWSQAVISGIPEILCGWRNFLNEKLVLSSTELMKTDDLPERAPMMISGRRFWEPEACLDTFHTLLSNIKEMIKEDNPRIVHRLELPEVKKGKGVKLRLQARRFQLLGRREDDYVILPDWYLRDFLKIQDDA